MKKKVLALSLALGAFALILSAGTMAYFSDKTEVVTNTFEFGNVKIDLIEDFDKDNATLVPGVDINKDVFVKNTGNSDAYVRVHIAIPTSADDGDPSFDASHNFLHFNFTYDSIADGQWSWLPEYTTGTGYRGNGVGNWNFYTTTVNNVSYNVYVVTYRSKLEKGETTATQSLDKVYLDTTVKAETDAEGKTTYVDNKGNRYDADKLDILVVAEATQADGFNDAYAALNASFGNPTSAGYVSPFNAN